MFRPNTTDILSNKPRKVDFADKRLTNNDIDTRNLAYDAKQLLLSSAQCLLNPALTVPFLFGPLYRQIPHVRASTPFGHLSFIGEKSNEFTAAALKTTNGIATFWSGPFPVLYVASNAARRVLVRESHVGIVDKASGEYLNWLSGGNQVMGTFPDFRPIDSDTYKVQRAFLLKRFHGGAKQRLPEIANATSMFLQQYAAEHGKHPRPLRELITALSLHTSSHLLGLTQVTLDQLYFEQPAYRDAIERVAKYGISERADYALETVLYQLFLQVLQRNFEQIRDETPETNLIRNIFASMDVEFPQEFYDFYQLANDIQLSIAMNFAATGLGAMVHSTANTLDWAVARLLNNQHKMDELVQLMATHKHLALTEEGIFDKTGPLFPVGEWVLHNVFLYPPFSHEFFHNKKAFVATLPDASTIDVPSMSFIVVNYVQCNRSNEQMTSDKTFSESLAEKSTTGRFIMNEQVASFGGSKISKDNPKSRICPGAKTSLYEQMIIIAILLRDYSLVLTDANEISCEVDANKHPLCSRVNSGNVILMKPLQSMHDMKQSIKPPISEQANSHTNLNSFFYRNAASLLRTGLTMGAAFALHNLTL